VHVAGVSLL